MHIGLGLNFRNQGTLLLREILSEVMFLFPFKSSFGFSIGKGKLRLGEKFGFIGFVQQISGLKQQKKGLYFGMICQKFGYFDLGPKCFD